MVKSKPETSQKKRDLRFDTLRGLFLVCMTINHLPTELRTVTDQSIGVFSAAEGFVFLSGLIAGWVYTRKLRATGEIWSASLARSKTIYLWHVASFLACFVCVQLVGHLFGFCSTTSPRLFYEHPLASLGLGFSLLYQPGLLDLLPMYCAFVLLLPMVIGSLEAGHRWRALAASSTLWLAAQLAPPLAGAPLGLINTGTFNLFAWQFLFVAGIAIGHARASGRFQVTRPNPWVVAGAALVAAYGFGIRHAGLPSLWPDPVYGIFLNKPSLGLLRIADFASIAYLVAILGERFPRLLASRPLALLGRHSLAVVAVQSVVVVVVLQFAPLFSSALSRTLTAAGVIAVLFAAAAAHERLASAPKAPAAPPLRTRHYRRRRILRTDGARTA